MLGLKAQGSKTTKGPFVRMPRKPATLCLFGGLELVQAADLVWSNIHRQFRDYGEDWEGEKNMLPLYEYFERICRKFRTDGRGRIQGYGIAKFPMLRRKRWRLQED